MPKRIETLTDAQKGRFDEWVEKWRAIGLSTESANFDVAAEAVKKCYELIDRPRPIVLQMSSPFAAVYGGMFGVVLLQQHKEKTVAEEKPKAKTDPLRAAIEAEVIRQLSEHIEIDDELVMFAKANMKDQIKNWTHYRGGNLWASWYAYISFFRDVCDWENEGLEAFGYDEQYALNAGWCWYGDDIAAIADRPAELHFSADNQLHYDRGPAALWRDGWAIWSLNGVRVPQWLVETSAEKLEPKQIVDIDNAEVRREFVRKVGVDRICYKLSNGPIDVEGDYELHRFVVVTGREWTYLKMLNPSVPEVWHLEGVPNACNTVAAALAWRNSLSPDKIDDENGADWYQQGDVILRPVGTKKFKSKPVILT
jgi:hypothetical protein